MVGQDPDATTGESLWAALAYGICMGACLVWLYPHIGVLAAITLFLVARSIGTFGLSLDGWAAPYGVVWTAILLLLAGISLWVALAGQPIFKDMLAEPQRAG